MKHVIIASLVAVFTAPVLFACGADGEISRTIDCAEICSRYSDCVTDIDVTDCTDYCEDRADADPNIERAADACNECIDDKSCAEASACIPNCALVPVPAQ